VKRCTLIKTLCGNEAHDSICSSDHHTIPYIYSIPSLAFPSSSFFSTTSTQPSALLTNTLCWNSFFSTRHPHSLLSPSIHLARDHRLGSEPTISALEYPSICRSWTSSPSESFQIEWSYRESPQTLPTPPPRFQLSLSLTREKQKSSYIFDYVIIV